MPFTQQQLEDAYKQMGVERQAEGNFATLAAKKLDDLLNQPNTTFGWLRGNAQQQIVHARLKTGWGNLWGGGNWGRVTPYSDTYELYTSLCQYDQWQNAWQQLSQVCNMQPYNGQYKVEGEFNLTNDPDFATAQQKIFPVTIDYYDSHASGW